MSREIRLTGVRMSAFVGGLLSASRPQSQHIEAVTDGQQSWTVAETVKLLEGGQRFYVEDSTGDKAYVEVVYPGLLGHGNSPYIKTRPDGTVDDNLLALPGGPLYRSGLLSAGGIINRARGAS